MRPEWIALDFQRLHLPKEALGGEQGGREASDRAAHEAGGAGRGKRPRRFGEEPDIYAIPIISVPMPLLDRVLGRRLINSGTRSSLR
jgi:hypothetical protein